MKKTTQLLTLTLLTIAAAPAQAGGISAGGPVQTLYRAVCYVRTSPQALPKYEIFVGFADEASQNDTFIDRDPGTDPVTVERLVTGKPETQPGGIEQYVGQDFALTIDLTNYLPGGAGLGGKFTGLVDGQTFDDAAAECQVFSQTPDPTTGAL